MSSSATESAPPLKAISIKNQIKIFFSKLAPLLVSHLHFKTFGPQFIGNAVKFFG